MATCELTTGEARAWQELSLLLAWLPSALDRWMSTHAGLTWFEFQVLAAAAHAPGGEIQLNALAAQTGGSLSRLSHVVTKLEVLGYLSRRTTRGVRGTRAAISAPGRAVVDAAAPQHTQALRALIFDELTGSQTAALADLLAQVARPEPQKFHRQTEGSVL